MATAQLRPDGTFVAPFQVVGAASSHAALSDNNDASYIVNSIAGFTRVTLTSTTIPAGAVFVSAQIIIRARQSGPPSGGQTPGVNTGFCIGNTQSFVDYACLGFGAGFSNIAATALNQNLSQSDLDNLCIYVQPGGTWGCDVSEAYVNVVIAEAPTAPTWTAPSGSVTGALRPTFSWVHNAGANGSGQTYFQVRIFTAAQAAIGGFDPGSSPATYDSGAVNTATASHIPTSDLVNGASYVAYVRTWGTTYGINQNSPWSGPTSFTMNVTVPIPTAVAPSTTQTTSRPVFNATVGAMAGGARMVRFWEVSASSGFGVIAFSATETVYETTKSLPFTPTWGTARLAQGNWFIRCRAIDQFGVMSTASATTPFTVSHPPTTANRLPTSSQSFPYATSASSTWVFQDPDVQDFQLKYEAELWKLSDPAGSLKTTGTITSGNQGGTWTGLDATWKDTELRWRVRVFDQDNIAGAFSSDQSFFLRDVPTIAITSPGNGQVISVAQPTVNWTFSASAGRTQTNWRVYITDRGSLNVVTDSGVQSGTATTYQAPSPVVQVGANYSVTLVVTDSAGLTNQVVNNFTANYVAPTTPVFELDGQYFTDFGLVTVDWSLANMDGTWVAWRVLRRQRGYSTWTEICYCNEPTVRLYKDYTAATGVTYEYSVVQVAISVGAQVESAYPIKQFQGESTHYMLVVPDNDVLNLTLYHVTADDFEDEQEMATMKLIGRGRRVEYGTRYGQAGSLTAEFRDNEFMSARLQRLYLEAIRDSGMKIFLRNPFGDVWAVALDSARITRTAGVGLREMATVTIAYSEITA
jgi:hypothetical protein